MYKFNKEAAFFTISRKYFMYFPPHENGSLVTLLKTVSND